MELLASLGTALPVLSKLGFSMVIRWRGNRLSTVGLVRIGEDLLGFVRVCEDSSGNALLLPGFANGQI
jgi:hypothetical protein